ncbi:uncharacterized protein CLUP02_08475 [Colletotrichum lupini]|uniref:Uncharacterized protein n=1 Tax=Colletotrichum lupini TaxID=145971 RepID=A0A9Q8WHN8_9PEZI|nr:uncharacterized protein CLUP02_08475 [Colletotrichum lupini]UQC82985.1 hypothetical protein CLUP02_08475 [Colletotrichum lupini]
MRGEEGRWSGDAIRIPGLGHLGQGRVASPQGQGGRADRPPVGFRLYSQSRQQQQQQQQPASATNKQASMAMGYLYRACTYPQATTWMIPAWYADL